MFKDNCYIMDTSENYCSFASTNASTCLFSQLMFVWDGLTAFQTNVGNQGHRVPQDVPISEARICCSVSFRVTGGHSSYKHAGLEQQASVLMLPFTATSFKKVPKHGVLKSKGDATHEKPAQLFEKRVAQQKRGIILSL